MRKAILVFSMNRVETNHGLEQKYAVKLQNHVDLKFLERGLNLSNICHKFDVITRRILSAGNNQVKII